MSRRACKALGVVRVVRVVRVVSAIAAGRNVNPKTAANQIAGGVAAAVANAVYNATGKRVRELPITLDKLL
jgi:CO/xanthine dehydrogenase Mo-binding subunit